MTLSQTGTPSFCFLLRFLHRARRSVLIVTIEPYPDDDNPTSPPVLRPHQIDNRTPSPAQPLGSSLHPQYSNEQNTYLQMPSSDQLAAQPTVCGEPAEKIASGESNLVYSTRSKASRTLLVTVSDTSSTTARKSIVCGQKITIMRTTLNPTSRPQRPRKTTIWATIHTEPTRTRMMTGSRSCNRSLPMRRLLTVIPAILSRSKNTMTIRRPPPTRVPRLSAGGRP